MWHLLPHLKLCSSSFNLLSPILLVVVLLPWLTISSLLLAGRSSTMGNLMAERIQWLVIDVARHCPLSPRQPFSWYFLHTSIELLPSWAELSNAIGLLLMKFQLLWCNTRAHIAFLLLKKSTILSLLTGIFVSFLPAACSLLQGSFPSC